MKRKMEQLEQLDSALGNMFTQFRGECGKREKTERVSCTGQAQWSVHHTL